MKKKFRNLILLVGLFLVGLSNVDAKEVSAEDIPNNSYVIGTHVFTEDTTLLTSHIMLGAKTIKGNTLADMVVYYKTPRGKWINGATGVSLTAPAKFEVDYIDLETTIEIEAPVLGSGKGGGITGGETCSDLNIAPYATEEYLNSISGYELYEIVDEEYVLIDSGDNKYGSNLICLDIGEVRTFVARVYVYDSSNQKIYSDYSNEYVMDNSTVVAPELIKSTVEYEDGVYNYGFLFDSDNYCYFDYEEGLDVSGIKAFEIYEKTGDSYTLVDSTDFDPNRGYQRIDVSVEEGTKKTFVARVYSVNKEGERIYSDYSNEVTVNESSLGTPTLTDGYGGGYTYHLTIGLEGYYTTDEKIATMDGWELYEKTENGYSLIDGNTVTVDIGEIRTYVARTYVLDETGGKIYSDYSNEYVIDNSKVATPTLSADYGSILEQHLTIVYEGTYSEVDNLGVISGWELWEKTGDDSYTGVDISASETSWGAFVEVAAGTSRTFVARVYALNASGEKVYSNYSNELVIDNTDVE